MEEWVGVDRVMDAARVERREAKAGDAKNVLGDTYTACEVECDGEGEEAVDMVNEVRRPPYSPASSSSSSSACSFCGLSSQSDS